MAQKENTQISKQRCGFVTVIGLPNAGKSTLVNTIVGTKVSIVSRKVQTTRSRVLGIALHEEAQIILIDTPGIFKPRKTLEKAMVSAALASLEDAEFIVHIIDASVKNTIENNRQITETLKKQKSGSKIILALNKVDKTDKSRLLELARDLNEEVSYEATFMISALAGKGTQDLAAYLSKAMPEGIWMFPEDQITDMPMRLMAAEITREKIYDQIHQEVPYSVFVKTENWERFDNGSVKIDQLIYVEKESQKSIVLGKRGAKIKAIGQAARKELEEILGVRVHLKTFVRVQENWVSQLEDLEHLGLDINQ
ncbi:MAG: GTPase Era [Alphaproteobacteria bacterium]